MNRFKPFYKNISTMCIVCHENLSDSFLLSEWTKMRINPEFENWKTLSHLTLSCVGLNGFEVKKIALELLSDYISYIETEENRKILDGYTLENLKEFQKECIESKMTKEQSRELFYSKNVFNQEFMMEDDITISSRQKSKNCILL